MAIEKVSKPSKGVDIPDGTHPALFLGLIHLGTQKGEYEGVVSYNDQVLLSFELPDITLDDGRPIILTARVNHKLGKKSTLLKVGKALYGGKDVKDGIDWEECIGKPLMLLVETNSKGTGSNIKGYMPISERERKALKPMINEPKLLYDVEKISVTELKGLSEWVQKVINSRIKDEEPSRPDTNY